MKSNDYLLLQENRLYVFTKSLIIIILIVSCHRKEDGRLIKIEDNELLQLNASDFFSSLEYIQLETNSECIINNDPRFYVLDNYIIVMAYRQCLLFDRQTGNFLREIGNYGKGPEEYNRTLYGYIVNEEKQTLYAGGYNNLIEYSFSNTMIGRIPLIIPASVCYIEDNLWVQSIQNIDGKNPNRLLFFDRVKRIDSVANHNFFEIKDFGMYIHTYEDWFYRFDNHIYYKNLFNDTLFHIVKNIIQPHYIFDTGKHSPPYDLKSNPNNVFEQLYNYYQIYPILETDPFIFFSVHYEKKDSAFLYDKHSKKTVKLKNGEKGKGFHNDIDGGLPFWPDYVNNRQELISHYWPFDLKETMFDYEIHSYSIRNNEAHEKLKRMLNNLKENDNPVVVIARLKKTK